MMRSLWILPFAALAVACAAPTADAVDDRSSELREKPRYTRETEEVLGEYTNDESCTGGFDACERIVLRRAGDRLEVVIGNYAQYYGKDLVVEAHPTPNGVLVFTTGELDNERPWGDCDDPGCGNIRKVSGVVYPVAEGDTWRPRVRATYTLEFLYPDEDDAPEGELRETRHLTKK
jgi:hypothetical protein